VAAAYASFQFYGGANYHDEIRGSLMAGEKAADPNFFAASLLLPLSLAVNGVLTPRRWLSRLGWLAIAGGLAFGVLVTMSRGAMVAMAVMILFYVFTSQVSRRMTIVVLAIFVGLGFAMPGVFFARLQSAADTGGAGRTVVWQGGLVAFQHFAVLGAGLNNFPYAYRKYIGGAPIYHGTLMSAAHNTYLEIAVELGIIGLALMLTAVISQLRAARRARKELPKAAGSVIVAYEAACYAILTAAFFIDIVWEKWFWLAWILLAVAVRTSRIEQQAVPAPARVTETARLRWYDWPARSTPRTRVP
jgi:O-antigen ligase